MTKHHVLYPLLGLVIMLFAGFWVKDMVAHARAEAIEAAEKKVSEAAQKRIDDRQKEFDTERQQLLARIRSVKTPQQAITALPSVIDLPAPITMLPDAPEPNTAQIPSADIKPLFDRLATCKLIESGLTKCDQDKKDMKEQIDAANIEAHQWKLAAKGGSKWSKFGKALKVIGCSAGGGYLGSFSGKQGAAIGAAAGAGVCSIF